MILADFHFSPRLRAAAEKLVCATCADGDEAPAVAAQLERSLRSFAPHVRTALVSGLTTLELAAVFRYGRPFSRLPTDKARAWFMSFWHSPIGLCHDFARGIRSLVAYAYYEQPSAKRRLEFHPDAWIAEVARRRLESYGAEIQRQEAELVPLRKVRHA